MNENENLYSLPLNYKTEVTKKWKCDLCLPFPRANNSRLKPHFPFHGALFRAKIHNLRLSIICHQIISIYKTIFNCFPIQFPLSADALSNHHTNNDLSILYSFDNKIIIFCEMRNTMLLQINQIWLFLTTCQPTLIFLCIPCRILFKKKRKKEAIRAR